jgi:predicted ester cyclase
MKVLAAALVTLVGAGSFALGREGEGTAHAVKNPNKTVVLRFFREVLVKGRLDEVDRLVATTFIDHTAARGAQRGRASLKRFLAAIRPRMSSFRLSIQQVLAEGDRVAVRWGASFNHTAEVMGMEPTGARIRVEGIDILRVAGGRIAERWSAMDRLHLVRQLSGFERGGRR